MHGLGRGGATERMAEHADPGQIEYLA